MIAAILAMRCGTRTRPDSISSVPPPYRDRSARPVGYDAANGLEDARPVVRHAPRDPGPLGNIPLFLAPTHEEDRKSTRLNSSHVRISYAVFCLKKKTKTHLS